MKNKELEKLRNQAKKLGIPSYWNKGEERLLREIHELEPPKRTQIPMQVNNSDHIYLNSVGFKEAWLGKYMDEDGIEKFEYIHKFRAFRCYIKGQHVDWVDINRIALDNGAREVCEILLSHQPLPQHRKVIGVNHD